jgi:hypothetical protein
MQPLLPKNDGVDVNTYREGRSFHFRGFILTLVVWGSLVGLFVRTIIEIVRSLTSDPYSYTWSWIDFLWFAPLACYVLYFIEGMCCSSTRRYVSNAGDESASETVVARMKVSAPRFTMHVTCYHYETRYRTVTTKDSEGRTQTRQESYQERVVTHRASGLIQYAAWTDSSTIVSNLGRFPLVKLELSKSYEFADAATARSFNQQRMLFRRMHDRDRHQTYSESFDVPGFKPNVLSCRNGVKPKYLTSSCFFLSTLLTLNWPFRMWLERHSMKTAIVIRKRVAANPQSLAVFGPLMFLGGVVGNFPLIEALVFQQMYGHQQPNIAPQVAEAIPVATAVPIADAVPCYDHTAAVVAVDVLPVNDESMTKEQRDAYFAQNPIDDGVPMAVAVAVPVE